MQTGSEEEEPPAPSTCPSGASSAVRAFKRGAKLVVGGGGAGNAFVGVPRVVRAIARDARLAPDHELVRLSGSSSPR